MCSVLIIRDIVAYSIAVRHYDYDMNDFKNLLISIVV